jgi:hypothetical protein
MGLKGTIGGAIYLSNTQDVIIRDTKFLDNVAQKGAGLYLEMSKAKLYKNTFVNN